MSDEEQDTAAPVSEEHLAPERLFALLWAKQGALPEEGAEGADPELLRLKADLDERYTKHLPAEFQLGPETATRLWEHALACAQCRLLLLEDGPSARPPRTKDEIAAAEQKILDDHQKKLIKFWVDLVVGLVAFGVAFYFINAIRSAEIAAPVQGALQADPRDVARQMDPRWLGFVVAILVASWFLAEAYTIARELWVDFTAWKAAVPVIGKRWAAKGKKQLEGQEETDDG